MCTSGADVLPYVYSRSDALKRSLGDLASNPADMLGMRNAQLKNATDNVAGGGLLAPQGSEARQRWSDALDAMAPGLLGITVYHGSPHVFDRFDPTKIGTGEGAQAYGHGLYFAENPGVAASYAKTLAPMKAFTDSTPAARLAADLISKGWSEGTVQSMVRNRFGPDAVRSALDGARRYEAAKNGSLYSVDLPDEHVAAMLHWDRPMTDQPANVQAALGMHDSMGFAAQDPKMTGQQAYHELALAMGSREQASDFLARQGIPGIRYPDAGSRAKAATGTHNFVVFPAATDLLSILGIQ
jgi:hypothetical protein